MGDSVLDVGPHDVAGSRSCFDFAATDGTLDGLHLLLAIPATPDHDVWRYCASTGKSASLSTSGAALFLDGMLDDLDLLLAVPAAPHHGVWKYCSSSGKVQAQAPENLLVRQYLRLIPSKALYRLAWPQVCSRSDKVKGKPMSSRVICEDRKHNNRLGNAE